MNYLQLIPQVIALVQSLEIMLPDTPGKQKFEMLIKSIEDITQSKVDDSSLLEKFVTTIVNIAKIFGVFKSKAT